MSDPLREAVSRVGDQFHQTRTTRYVSVDPNDLSLMLRAAGYYDPSVARTPSLATKLRETWPIIPLAGPLSRAQRELAHKAASGLDLLTSIRWRSADKDNMEFTATITYSQMDAILELANA